MLIVFDYECTKCGARDVRYVNPETKDAQKCGAGYPHCGAPLTRLPAATRTNFKFADRSAHKRARK